MKSLVWDHLPCNDEESGRLAAALGVHPIVARLLCLRGLADAAAADRFLNPSLDHLHDPFRLADMDRAVARLEEAIARRERIAIHGDYDVDGITSTVMLRRALELLGGEVVHFIPERLRDGYGLQPSAIDRLHAEGVRLVVSVDCGIRGTEAALRARDLGVDLIVTDHHEPDGTLPAALAVINPKRHDCSYPDKNLAGVGVALKVVQALIGRAGKTKWLPSFVKIAALGTLADVVPLVGENRVIARLGLAALSSGPHTVGLRALLEGSGLGGRRIDSYEVAFILAPRVNAAGRMSTPDIATRLLLATDEAMGEEARGLAQQLNDENARRQQEEADLVASARTAIDTDPAVGAHNVLVVGGAGWHRGVIGIAASKLVDAYHKPSIVLSVDGELAHGSCRSIPEFDMLGALERCADVFLRFGGHHQAAGLTMEAARVPEFRARINAYADAILEPDQLRPRLKIDGPLSLRAITPDLMQALDRLGPFGMANPRPVFHAAGVEIVDGPRTLKARHLKMTFCQDGRRMRAIAWRAAERAEFLTRNRASLDLAFSLERSEYQGETYLELRVADFKAPGEVE
ncbi:MAG: single-stranded-DNA-specific exonuclease RecJ [Acidobacteria bacterium RIFCSPLOWO2_02_FULL_67_36]|nr:MAG: single-stranded-DNA-specific exonuclease RecJ [Acidobacteria bacterium RIFCSPLOWO2_02_FULL_67_36]OFW18647.1 MAG: single-stranded-DNA-specific exonuclease RecJ [Acidobacteria bacterium RIFCSPLOWO2_12_FULL_66_21]